MNACVMLPQRDHDNATGNAGVAPGNVPMTDSLIKFAKPRITLTLRFAALAESDAGLLAGHAAGIFCQQW